MTTDRITFPVGKNMDKKFKKKQKKRYLSRSQELVSFNATSEGPISTVRHPSMFGVVISSE